MRRVMMPRLRPELKTLGRSRGKLICLAGFFAAEVRWSWNDETPLGGTVLMKTALWLLRYSVVALALVIYSGCDTQKTDVPETYPVSIKIAYNGQPVEGANVSLIPEDPAGRGASGVTDASGVAKMGLPGLTDGAMPGKYGVTVSKVEGGQSDPNLSPEEFYRQQSSEPSAAPSSPKHILPVKYLSAGTSELECTVTEQDDQTYEFDLSD